MFSIPLHNDSNLFPVGALLSLVSLAISPTRVICAFDDGVVGRNRVIIEQ